MKRILILMALTSCAQMKKADEERIKRFHELGEIKENEAIPVTQTEFEHVKPFLRSQSVGSEKLWVVYKAGPLRKRWARITRQDFALNDKDFKKFVDQELFTAKHFQEYVVFLPRNVKPDKIQVFQEVKGQKIKPYFVEPLDGQSASMQSLFPFTNKNMFPLLVKFKKSQKLVPPLVVQIDEGKSAQFQWRRPKSSKKQ